MKKSLLISLLVLPAIGTMVTLLPKITYATSTVSPQAAATWAKFFCDQDSGLNPATVARTSRGGVPVIRWTSDYFANNGWSPEKRCEAVSDRFQRYYLAGELYYLTTGIQNGYPVICTAERKGGACKRLLVTLKPTSVTGRTASQALQDLMAVRSRAANGPMYETGQRLYIDIQEYLVNAPLASD